MFFRFSLSIILALLTGCNLGPNYSPPQTPVPENWKGASTTAEGLTLEPHNWWTIFNDATLNCLEKEALENSPNVFIAYERIMQARALAGIEDSKLFPHLYLEPSYINREILWMLYDPVRVIREHRRRNELPIVMNYEVDLWGKLKKAYESSIETVEAEEDAFQTTLLLLTTDIASSYYKLRTYDKELSLLEDTLSLRQRAYEIVLHRYQGKITDYTDVSRAKLEYSNTSAEYHRVHKLRELEENRLAVLVGLSASDFRLSPNPLVDFPPIIPLGLPSDVLLQRPDIAAAERAMAANHSMIGVAYASFFPSLSLTGGIGYSSPELKDFLHWKSRLTAIGGNISQIIFDAGQLHSNLQLAVSKFREADQEYQQTVLEAFKEVEDALVLLEGLKLEYASIENSVEAAKTTYSIASVKYTHGATFYLDVVYSERDLLEAERSLIAILGQRFEATIQLIRAIGGGWAQEWCDAK